MTWGPQWFVRLPHWLIMRVVMTVTCVVVIVNTYLTAMPWLPPWMRILPPDRSGLSFQPLPIMPLGCSTFPTQAAAQQFLRDHPTLSSRLDADHDGIACESNRGPRDLVPVGR